MDGAAAREVECMGRRRAHRHARSHHAYGRKRVCVGVDAASRRNDIVRFGRDHAAQRNVIDVAVREALPVDQLRRVVELDPPGAARNRVVGAAGAAYVVERELLPADDPARLSNAGVPVVAHVHVGEHLGKLVAQELDDGISLLAALEYDVALPQRVERGLEVGDVRECGPLARKREQEPIVPHEAVRGAALAQPFVDFLVIDRRDEPLVVALENEIE
jgi:hypothetical protein